MQSHGLIAARSAMSRAYSRVMWAACVASAALILAILVLVLWYLVSIGWQSVTGAFFTQDPQPYGAEGYPGGMRNSLLGTTILVGLASLVGVPTTAKASAAGS